LHTLISVMPVKQVRRSIQSTDRRSASPKCTNRFGYIIRIRSSERRIED